MKAAITATARYLPERIFTNADMEKLVDTNDEWIRTRTGISERRFVVPGQATADMGTRVTQKLLERSGYSPEEIDVIIVATITPDLLLPSTAALIQNNLGAKNAWGFDLSGACTGFLYALETGAKFVESGKYSKVVVIGADTMSSILNFEDRNTCVLFGDGAGAVLLEPSLNSAGIIDAKLHLDGSGAKNLFTPAGGSLKPASAETVANKEHYVQQDGKAIFKVAAKGMADVSLEILERNNFNGSDVKLFIPHQANKRIIDVTSKRCGFNEDQVVINIGKYGNTTAGTIPIGIDESVEKGKLRSGDLLLLAAFGAGYSWGSMLIRW